jgi:colanic acid biosynthesis protein WcaH
MLDSQNFLSAQVFRDACRALPLVSIDLFVTRQWHKKTEVLLGYRNNAPARGYLFTPGGRIRKNEKFQNALARIALEELGLEAVSLTRVLALGVWDHFYADSAFDAEVSTHYVNLPYRLDLSDDEAEALQSPAGDAEQHLYWRWVAIEDAISDPLVHENVRVVLVKCL